MLVSKNFISCNYFFPNPFQLIIHIIFYVMSHNHCSWKTVVKWIKINQRVTSLALNSFPSLMCVESTWCNVYRMNTGTQRLGINQPQPEADLSPPFSAYIHHTSFITFHESTSWSDDRFVKCTEYYPHTSYRCSS